MSLNMKFRAKNQIIGLFLVNTCFFFCITRVNAGFLYLLNDDSTGNRIYGFRVNESTGALTPLNGFPVNAMVGGINNIVSERMFADASHYRLYVVNEGSDTVSVYSVDQTTGAITPMPFSPITLGSGVWNSIAVHQSGSPMIVANNALNGVVQSFVITATTATPAAGSPFPVGNTAGFSSVFSRDGAYYYVGGNMGANIAGFSVDAATGVLTTLSGSPFPSGGTAPLAYGVDTQGRLFAVDNTFFIRAFTSSSGVLSTVTGSPFTSGLTQRRFGLVHPNGNFYIVAGNSGDNVGVFQISGSGSATTLAPVTGSPFATGATTANCLAITNSGNFLYVGNRISRNVTTFSVNTSTGQLTSLGNLANNTLGTVGAINGIGYLPDVASAPANIGGRIVTASGSGVARVYVKLTSMDGMTNLLARTNIFGFYSFLNVPTGQVYTLMPAAKAFSFTPPSLQINHTGEVTNANFVGQPN